LNTSFGARERTLSAQGSIPDEDDGESDLHWEAIERLLFIYAKLNPAISYVQGMNELIAPIYYVISICSQTDVRFWLKMSWRRIQRMQRLIHSIYSQR
jgi:hypothetical protein